MVKGFLFAFAAAGNTADILLMNEFPTSVTVDGMPIFISAKLANPYMFAAFLGILLIFPLMLAIRCLKSAV
jgi:hypothetical protein